jgi:hypothetical protein
MFLNGTNVFKKGRERQGAPIITRTDENVTKIRELVQSVRWSTYRMICDELDMSK